MREREGKRERKREKEKEKANRQTVQSHPATMLPALASAIHCGGCQWPRGYERCSSASLHISLGGARHKAGHDVTSNLHTLRVWSRASILYTVELPLHTRDTTTTLGIGSARDTLSLSLPLASCLVYRPDKIRSGRYARPFGKMWAESCRNEKRASLWAGTKIPIRPHRFNAAEFIPAQLILPRVWSRVPSIVGLLYGRERNIYVE